MRKQWFSSILAVASVFAVVSVGPAPASGQSTWTPSRLSDGQPDVQGFWRQQGANVPSYDIENGTDPVHAKIMGWKDRPPSSIVVDPSDGRVPYQPWARAKREALSTAHTNPSWEELDPQAKCYPDGIPRINYQGEMQIIQPPGFVVFLYSFTHEYRIVPVDGRPHIGAGIRYWMGDNRGHWEGNTLVIDITNNNDKFWFDVVGDFHSPALHMVERLNFVTADRVNYEITVEDPNVYTRPWKMALNIERNKEPGYYLLEEACYEGNARNVPLFVRQGEEQKAKK